MSTHQTVSIYLSRAPTAKTKRAARPNRRELGSVSRAVPSVGRTWPHKSKSRGQRDECSWCPCRTAPKNKKKGTLKTDMPKAAAQTPSFPPLVLGLMRIKSFTTKMGRTAREPISAHKFVTFQPTGALRLGLEAVETATELPGALHGEALPRTRKTNDGLPIKVWQMRCFWRHLA